jgi:hypothetical protein
MKPVYNLSPSCETFYFGADGAMEKRDAFPIRARFIQMVCRGTRSPVKTGSPKYGTRGFIVDAEIIGGVHDGRRFETIQEADGRPWIPEKSPTTP